MAKSPILSIIICTYNRAGYLRDSLQSLLETNATAKRFEVLVIDNNSTDKTPSIVEKSIQTQTKYTIRYVQETAQGLSHARNRGIEEASGEVLLFLDDDVRVPSHFIPAWLSFFDEHPTASGGGGKIRVQFDDPCPPWMSHFLMPLLGYHDLGNSIKKYPANKYPFGGNMAFRRKIFQTYGTFHTDLGRKGSQLIASEEKEFYNRLSGDEEIYYLPDAWLYHRVGKERLTEAYIRKQAVGLGQSMALQIEEAPFLKKTRAFGSEAFKSMGTIALSAGYSFAFQFSKAQMLIKFRRWIWKGYRRQKNAK